jgi:hypothetical protein
MRAGKISIADKVLLYSSSGALVAAAMLLPFATVAAAHEMFEMDDSGAVLCYLIAGLLTARVVGLIMVPRRPMR